MQESPEKRGRKPERVLVTGGGGFLGFAVVERLRRRGDGVVSFSRSRYPELDTLGVEQISGDIRDPEPVARALHGVDAVFHVAAKPGVWGRYADYFDINVQGTRNVIAACRRHGVSRMIYTSSPSVVFDGRDMEGVDESVPYPARYHAAYPETKAMAEREVRKAAAEGLRTIVLRPHLIWGPRDNHLVPRIIARADRLARVGDGTNRVDTIYIDNAADAHVLASDALRSNPELSGRVYFISQGEPVLLWDMVDRILAAAGIGPVKRTVSKGTAWVVGALLEAAYGLFRIESEPPMTRFVANELSTSHWFDISAARRDLGYVPGVSMAEGLERLKASLRPRSQHR